MDRLRGTVNPGSVSESARAATRGLEGVKKFGSAAGRVARNG